MKSQVIIVLVLMLAAPMQAAVLDNGVRIFWQDHGAYNDIMIANPDPCPVTVNVNLRLTNAECAEGVNIVAAVPAETTQRVATVRQVNPFAGYWLAIDSWWWDFGSRDAGTAPITCRLPFAPGMAYVVCQGGNGTISHSGYQQYAIDWSMPEGTPIHAARGGIVVKTETAHAAGGADPAYSDQANFVSMVHDDGTVGEYVHLRQDGVAVSVGDRVNAGQLLGYSGNTGWSTAPHLHFRIHRPINTREVESIPLLFSTVEQGIVTLVEGQSYTCPVGDGQDSFSVGAISHTGEKQ